MKALFLDLDGTVINTLSGRKFPAHSTDWKLNLDVFDIIKACSKKGYKIIIVSNQGGIEKGYVNKDNFVAKITSICEKLEKLLKLQENSIIYNYCDKMESYYRKPNPGMAFELAIDYELDLHNSIMVGDMITDGEFASNAGISTYIDVTKLPAIDLSDII